MVVGESVPSCGMFWDLFSVLVVLNKGAKRGKDVSDAKYLAERAQLTVCETDLKGTMTHCLPLCLFSKNGALVSALDAQKVGMQGCPSYLVWIGDGRDSYRDTLEDLLEAQTKNVRATISDGSGGQTMAEWLLDMTVLQWASYVQFVDKFYTKLVNDAKFTPSGAWRLMGRCSSAIFWAMCPFRTKVERLNDLNLPPQKAAMIWAVFQCHRIMDEFKSLKFESHPAIIREISMFIITERVDPEQVVTLSLEINKVKTENKRLSLVVETLESGHTALKRDIGNLQNELDQLKKKIK
mmetsp:Transcript_22921/g.34751  ORF Transcript_22921/g.34751 Transcript_22921/m.34751 type:complete len:295 (+) Transcript_22921:845-1729(+)